jgi:hypothetical protein
MRPSGANRNVGVEMQSSMTASAPAVTSPLSEDPNVIIGREHTVFPGRCVTDEKIGCRGEG